MDDRHVGVEVWRDSDIQSIAMATVLIVRVLPFPLVTCFVQRFSVHLINLIPSLAAFPHYAGHTVQMDYLPSRSYNYRRVYTTVMS